jgi:hypothetical protein
MTEEEEKEQTAQQHSAAKLMSEAAQNIQGGNKSMKPDAPSEQDVLKQMQDVKNMRNMDPKALKDFLKGPPPAEIAQDIRSALKATEEQKHHAVPVSPTNPQSTSKIPEAAKHEMRKDGELTIMKLARTQFNTIQQQISKLMMGDGGKRSQASQEEEDSEPGHTEGDHISTEAGLHRHLLGELGEKRFNEAYALLRAVTEDDDEAEIMAKVGAILGDKEECRNGITQLIAFEDEAKH